ncbi:MAG: hypothetical protein H6703_05000 [Myxococcales bacterium]|nr:hypothetical protein [Myxococcales bacterium]MCB9550740.1 hypothetical protein [Myxococcales bacterium]
MPTARHASRLLALLALTLAAPAIAQSDPAPERVQMSLERYGQLLRTARRADGPQATWSRGDLRVELPADPARPAVARLDARLTLTGDGTGEIPILPAQAIIQSATLDGSDLALLQLGGAHVALVRGDQTVSLSLTWLVPREAGDDGAPVAVVPLPPLPGAALTVTGAGDGAGVYPGADVQRGGGQLTASLPPTPAVVIRAGAAGGGHAVRRAAYVITLDAAGNGADVAATFEATLDGRQADVRIAQAASALIDAREGNTPLGTRVVDGWHTARVEGRGRHTVSARFRVAVDRTQGQPQIALHPYEVPITDVDLTVPGKAEVTVEPPVPVTAEIRGDGERATTRARLFLPPTEEAVLRWTEARAAPETKVRVNTETYQLLTLEEGVLRSRVLARYDVIYGKVRELLIGLPENVVPYRVIGEGIEDWRVLAATDDLPRHVRVILGEDLAGKLALELQIEVPVSPTEGTAITLPLVAPVETEQVVIRQQGVIALFDGDKVGFAPATADGFSKVGADALPVDIRQTVSDKVNQAFKHLGPPTEIRSAVAAARAKETRFDARIDTLYVVRETTLTAQASVLVEIKSGRRDTLHLSVPSGISEPRITGPSINKVELDESFDAGPGRQAWRVGFTQALEGAILLDVEFERLLDKALGPMPLPDLIVHGAEVQSGSFGIAAEAGMEVQEKARDDVRPTQVEELPKAVRLRSDRELRLAYQYARTPWSLELDVRAHAMVDTLDAEAEQARFETNVLEAGYVEGRASYRVQNTDRQYLRVTLPEGARPLRVSVDGRRVEEVRNDEGQIAIPLPKDASTRIDITWQGRGEALGIIDGIDLVAPSVDLRTRDIQWLVRVPADRGVFGVDTEMKELGPWQFSALDDSLDALPADEASVSLAFAQPVHNADDPRLAVSFTLGAALGDGAGTVFLLVALVCLALFVRRRAQGRPTTAGTWALLAVGLAALLLKATLWRLDGVEAVLVLVAVLAVAIYSRRQAKRGAV